MKVSHLVLFGEFLSAPQSTFLHTLLPDLPVRHCHSVDDLTEESLNSAMIVSQIEWLDALSQSDQSTLRERLQGHAGWVGVSAPETEESCLMRWLQLGIDILLPQAFERPLLDYLPLKHSGRKPIALVLTSADEQQNQLGAMLREQDYNVLYHSPGSSLRQCLASFTPELIIAQDSAGLMQLKLTLHQLGKIDAAIIALTETDKLISSHLPEVIRVIPRSGMTQLTQWLQQQKSDRQKTIQDRNRAYFSRIEQLLQVLGESAIISRTNRAGKLTQANARFCSISGYTESELLGQTHRIIKSDLHPTTFFKSMWQRLSLGKVWHGVVCNRNKQGGLYWISTRMFPIANAFGQVDSYVCISSDISALQHDRLRLQQLTELFQIDQTHAAPWHCDLRNGRIYWSSRALRLLDGTAEPLPEHLHDIYRMVVPADRLPTIQAIGRSIRSQQPFNLVFGLQLSDHKTLRVTVTGFPIHDEQNRPAQLQGILQEAVGEALPEVKNEIDSPLFQQLFYASEHCMAISDAEGYILFTNPAYQRVMGYSAAEVTGRHCSELMCNDQTTARHLTHQLLAAEQPWQGITTRQRKDGSEFTAANLFGPIRNEAGEITHLFTTFADISHEVEVHQALSADRDAAMQASLAKSEFLSRFGHELRTPLNSVLGFAQLLEQDPQLNTPQQEQVQAILGAGRHLLDVINSILDLSRIEAGKVNLSYARTDLHTVMKECRELLHHLAREKQISIDQSGLIARHLTTDRLRLKQVLLNLLSNALLYTQNGGNVTLKSELLPGNALRIEVSDNGPGISPHQLESIFQPYKRLQQHSNPQSGTGIGLAICHQLIELMNGTIGVTSEPGKGATFWIELPLLPHTGSQHTLSSGHSNCQLFDIANLTFEENQTPD